MTQVIAEPDSKLAQALDFIGELRLPSGLRMADSWATDPWIRDSICIPLLAKAPHGKPLHRFSWIELPKGSGKTSTAAALALVEAAMEPATFVYCVAVDADQASILLDALSGLIASYPRLKAQIVQRQRLFTLSNGSRIQVMASDVPSFHGLGARARRLIFILEEVCQWATSDLYFAAISSLAKHPNSALWVLTNAGLLDSWQEGARAQLKATGAHMHISPEGWLPSWISEEDIEALRGTMPEPLWLRYFRNVWVSAVAGAAISEEEWDACAAKIPPLDPRTQLVCSIDAGVSSDSFAITAVSRDDGQVERELVTNHAVGFSVFLPRKADAAKVLVRAVKIWVPEGGPLDFAAPYDWLSGFVRSHRVACIVFDPYQLHDFATRFQQEHGVWCEAFDQGGRRSQADVDLLTLIRSRRLLHDGDPELRTHALNAALKMSIQEDTRARFVKSHSSKKIDGLVSLSMAAAQVLYLNIGT